MAIAYVNSADNGVSDTTSLPVTSGTGATTDVLVVNAQLNGNAGSTITVSSIAGGSLTYNQVGAAELDGSNVNHYCYVTNQVGTTSGVTVTITMSRSPIGSSGQDASIYVHRYGGCDTTPLGNESSLFTAAQSTSFGGGSITVTSGNTSVLLAYQVPQFGQTFTTPTNWTERYDQDTRGVFDRVVPSTTTYNPQATSTNHWFNNVGFHFELVVAASVAARRVDRVVRPAGARINSNFY
jgi:hypothetical protein